MRAKIVSDLHLSFYPDQGKEIASSLNNNADILIIPGDLTSGTANLPWLLRILCDRFEDVVFVLGNHSHYGCRFEDVPDAMSKINISNLHWLNNEEKVIKGKTFVGGTLWFENVPMVQMLYKTFNDFIFIKNLVPNFPKSHAAAINAIKNSKPDIVVTHHLPLFQLCDPDFAGDLYNIFFATNLENLIFDVAPKYWVAGHTHKYAELTVGNTKLIVNPYGYKQDVEAGRSTYREVIIDL